MVTSFGRHSYLMYVLFFNCIPISTTTTTTTTTKTPITLNRSSTMFLQIYPTNVFITRRHSLPHASAEAMIIGTHEREVQFKQQ